MRRKSDMWQEYADSKGSFLPGEGEQAARAAAADVCGRLAMVEEQLRSQFTSMAAYAQISQQAVETARAESRADLDREKATLVNLIERVREEGGAPSAQVEAPVALRDEAIIARIAQLEDKFIQLTQQFAMTLRYQEELANSVTHLVEAQMRNAGWLTSCGQAAS
jgi:hypothetical protein